MACACKNKAKRPTNVVVKHVPTNHTVIRRKTNGMRRIRREML